MNGLKQSQSARKEGSGNEVPRFEVGHMTSKRGLKPPCDPQCGALVFVPDRLSCPLLHGDRSRSIEIAPPLCAFSAVGSKTSSSDVAKMQCSMWARRLAEMGIQV